MSYVYDAGADTLIRADGLAAVTATTVVAPIDFEYGFNKNVAVVINVTAIDIADADETYVLSVQSADAIVDFLCYLDANRVKAHSLVMRGLF